MLRFAAATLAAVVILPTATARYIPLSFAELVGGADLICVATITNVDGDSFDAEVSDVLAGHLTGKAIRVQKFRDWTCASRWTAYAVEQKLLLFLTAGDGKFVPEGVWRIMGAGDSGEMPIVGEFIYPRVRLQDRPRANNRYGVYGGTRTQRAPLEPFLAAVRDVRTCYQFSCLARRRPNGIKQICDDAELVAFAERSELHSVLVKDIQRLAADLERRWRGYIQNFRKDPSYENWILWAVEVAEGFGKDDPRRAETLALYAEHLRAKGRFAEAKQVGARTRKP